MKKYLYIVTIIISSYVGQVGAEDKEPSNNAKELLRLWEDKSAMSIIRYYMNPEFAANIHAIYCRKLFDALVDDNFTKEQAMRIVVAQCKLSGLKTE